MIFLLAFINIYTPVGARAANVRAAEPEKNTRKCNIQTVAKFLLQRFIKSNFILHLSHVLHVKILTNYIRFLRAAPAPSANFVQSVPFPIRIQGVSETIRKEKKIICLGAN